MLLMGVMLCLSGCEGSDLPPVRAASTHFRYHARNASDVQSDILDRLERDRADFYNLMGLSGDAITDYYYFTDPSDLQRNGPCALPLSDCTVAHSAFASVPFHQHELIHTYMADVGAPSVPLLEGTAESVGCLRSASASDYAAETDWRRVVQEYPTTDLTLYASDERFMTYLMNQMGISQTVEYYRTDSFTLDPDTFATNVQQFWNLSIDALWLASVGTGAPQDFLPVCPCSVDPITVNEGPVSITHPNAAEYRPIAAGTTPLTIDFTSNGYVGVQDCARNTPGVQMLQQSLSGNSSTVILQPGPEQYFLTFQTQGTDTFTPSQDLALQPACANLSTFAAGARANQLAIAVPRSSGSAWFVSLATATSLTVGRADEGTGALSLCSDCTLTDCQPLNSFGTSALLSGSGVLEFMPDSSSSTQGLDVALVFFH